MSKREKLIDLLQKATDKWLDYLDETDQKGLIDNKQRAEFTADYLLAKGAFVPPCKVGDVVYVKYYGEIVNAYVTEFEINSRGLLVKVYIDPDTDREYDEEDVFPTKEAAEEALRGECEGE